MCMSRANLLLTYPDFAQLEHFQLVRIRYDRSSVASPARKITHSNESTALELMVLDFTDDEGILIVIV